MSRSKILNLKLKLNTVKLLIFGFFFLAFSYYLLAIYLPSVHAQSAAGLDLTVSPPVIELNAKPGDKLKQKFRIRNNLSAATTLRVDVKKLSSDSTSGEPIPAEPKAEDEFVSWVKVDPSDVTVQPKEWADVNFNITIPESAAYGYYYVLRIQPVNQTAVKGVGASVKGEVYVVVLLNVLKEGAISKGSLVEFAPSTFVSEYVPVDFTVKVENKGNIHIKPSGNVFIRSFHQNDVAILDINASKGSVLPGGTRTFTTSWNDGFIVRELIMEGGAVKLDSKGKPETRLTINWDKLTHFRVGPYTATLLMVYDDGKRDATIEGTTTFWLIPYTALIVIAIGLIALIIIIRFLLKWYVNRELNRRGR